MTSGPADAKVCVYSAVSGERACAIFTCDWQLQSENGITINLCRDHILCSKFDLRGVSMISSSTVTYFIWNTVCDDSIFFSRLFKVFHTIFVVHTHTNDRADHLPHVCPIVCWFAYFYKNIINF